MRNGLYLLIKSAPAARLALVGLLVVGCATQKIDWNARVGNYTKDQAVMEFGPPDKQARLEDGTTLAEWLTRRGYTQTYVSPGWYGCRGRYYGPLFPTVVESSGPDYYLRLIFGPDGKLRNWKQFAK